MEWNRSLRAIAAVENRDRLRWAVRVRWLVVGGFLGLAMIAWAGGRLASIEGCVAGALFGAALNGVNHWGVHRWRWIAAISVAALVGDVVLISWVVVDTGGLRSPLLMMYVVQVVATAMLVDLAVAALSAAFCVAGFVAALSLQRTLGLDDGWLPAIRPAELVADQLIWALFLLYCLGLLVYLGGYISDKLRASERHLEAKNRDLLETVGSLERAHRHLAATHERLKQTEAQLIHSEKIRALGQFVAGIAHELNNPIAYVSANLAHLQTQMGRVWEILTATEALSLTVDDRTRLTAIRQRLRVDELIEDLPSLLNDCSDGVRRAQEIIAGLRAFARGERDEAWQLADLHAGLDASLALLRHRVPVNVTVERCYGALPLVECLPGQLSQVFVNLLANAADAVGDRGRIAIETGMLAADDHAPAVAIVTIRDDGPGIAPEALPRLFEPFFTTKQVGEGVGLGLSVSHGIIERHGGRISVASEVGRGSAFSVVLPLRRPSDSAVERAPVPNVKSSA